MGIKVGINGFGRIGRLVYRACMAYDDVTVVAVNDLMPVDQLAYLLKYDTMHRTLDATVEAQDRQIIVNGEKVHVFEERNPADIKWDDFGVDVVIESTGLFRARDKAAVHMKPGVKHVLISAPAGDADKTVVLGVNDDELDKDAHKVISNASCTTNCLAPVVKVFREKFGIKSLSFLTVHAYTNDQTVLDVPHKKDYRRGRTAAQNIIPTSTGASKAVMKIFPDLDGKVVGSALRVPVADGSATHFTFEVEKATTAEEVNAAIKAGADSDLAGVLEYNVDPIVSADILGNPHSSIFDALSTTVTNGTLVNVISWYDNEWGYSCRLVDLARKLYL